MSILPFEVSLYESMIRDLEPFDSWKAMAAELGRLYLAHLESAQVANDRNTGGAHG